VRVRPLGDCVLFTEALLHCGDEKVDAALHCGASLPGYMCCFMVCARLTL
jgi:hypothetical protein